MYIGTVGEVESALKGVIDALDKASGRLAHLVAIRSPLARDAKRLEQDVEILATLLMRYNTALIRLQGAEASKRMAAEGKPAIAKMTRAECAMYDCEG